MGVIDVHNFEIIEELAETSGLRCSDVREVVEQCGGDEFEVRNRLQNLIINREITQKALRN
jgi:hypothetical protein